MKTEPEIELEIRNLKQLEEYYMKFQNYCDERAHKIFMNTPIFEPYGKRYANLCRLAHNYSDKRYNISRMRKALSWVIGTYPGELP